MTTAARWPRYLRSFAATTALSAACGVAYGQQPTTSQQPATTQQPTTGAQQPSNLRDLNLEQLLNVPVGSPTGGQAAGGGTTGGTTTTASGSSISVSGADAGQAASTGQLLDRAPSVSVRRTSAINLDPRVRGFNASQLNANANGITQLKTRIDIDSQFSQIDPGNVQSIEVIDGPYTSLYGPGFAFLKADLIAPQRFECGPEYHGSVNFSFANNGRQVYNRERFWGGGPNWGFDVSYGLRTGEDYRPGGDPGQVRVPASYRQDDVFFAFSQDLTCTTRVEFNYLRLNLYNVELPGVAYDINNQHTDQFNVRLVRQDDPKGPEQMVLQFWHARTPYNGDASRLAKQQSFSEFFIWEPFPQLTGGNLLANGLSESSGLRGLLTFGDAKCPQLTLGLDWRRYAQFYREIDLQADGVNGFDGDIFGIPRSSQENVGVLAHFSLPVDDSLKLTAGGRLDYASTYLDRSDPVVVTTGETGGAFRPGVETPDNFLGMAYATIEIKPTCHLTVTGGLAFAQRMPNLAELYSDEPFVPLVRFGNSFSDANSELEPETNFQIDVGVQGKWDDLTFGAKAFQATVYDYILAVPSNFSTPVPAGVTAPTNLQRDLSAFGITPTTPDINFAASTHSLAYQYTNIDRASFYGFEFVGEYKLNCWMALNGTLAYVKGTNHDPVRFDDATKTYIPTKGAEALPNIYPFNGQIGLRFFEPTDNSTPSRWSIEFVAQMVNGQYYVADSFGEVPTPGFTVFNINAFYQLNQNLRLRTAVENLLDRDYTEHGSLAIANPLTRTIGFVREPGFTWTVGFEAKF